MKKIFMVSVFFFLTLTQSLFAENICTGIDMAWINNHIPLPKGVKILHKKQRFEMCEIVVDINGTLAPLYASKDYIIAGQMIKNKEVITGNVLKSLTPTSGGNNTVETQRKSDEKRYLKKVQSSMDLVEKMVSISYKPKNSSNKKLFVFTDPLCGFCTKTLNYLKPIADKKKFEIKVIVYPLLGENSANLSNYAISKKISLENYIDSDWKRDDYSKLNKTDRYLEIKKIGENNFRLWGINAVPVILGEEGQFMITGADFEKIDKKINELY